MPYRGIIIAPHQDADELRALGVVLGPPRHTDAAVTGDQRVRYFADCQVSDLVMTQLAQYWGRWDWNLFSTKE